MPKKSSLAQITFFRSLFAAVSSFNVLSIPVNLLLLGMQLRNLPIACNEGFCSNIPTAGHEVYLSQSRSTVEYVLTNERAKVRTCVRTVVHVYIRKLIKVEL